ncbi:MAG: AhpC/TSA family [Blastocatellia bacterium]
MLDRLGNLFSSKGLWILLFALAAGNTLLLKQNLQMRAALNDLSARLNPAAANLKQGDKAPPFASFDLGGSSYEVTYNGSGPKRAFLFFTPDCPYCGEQAPFWRMLLDQTDAGQIEVIGVVSEKEDRQKLAQYITAAGFTQARNPLKVILAPESVIRSYKLSMTPTTLVVANDGSVENIWLGKWDASAIVAARAAFHIPL